MWYSSFIEEEDIWDEKGYSKHVQKGDDLGKRMNLAFKSAFERGCRKVVIIGSDCAELTSEVLYEAFNILDQQDFVIGPANDGGYYLLGMTQYQPELFQNIRWSTDSVFEVTYKQIQDLKMTCGILPQMSDVDTQTDWEKVSKDSKNNIRNDG